MLEKYLLLSKDILTLAVTMLWRCDGLINSDVKGVTVKEMADKSGVSKMTIYRYLKNNHISEVAHEAQIKYYDVAVLKVVIEHFKADDTETKREHVIDDVTNDKYIKQLEDDLKQERSEKAQLIKLLDQEQQLHLLAENQLKELKQLQVPKETKKSSAEAQNSSLDDSDDKNDVLDGDDVKFVKTAKKSIFRHLFSR